MVVAFILTMLMIYLVLAIASYNNTRTIGTNFT